MARPPKAVIFDWDNTLVDSWPTIHAALNRTLEAWEKPQWSLEETKQRVRHSMRDSFPALFGEDWQKAGDHYRDQYRSLHLENLAALEQADALLEELAGIHALTLFVISNKTGEILRKEASHIGWEPFFHKVIGSGDAPNDKPSPDIVTFALENSGFEPQDVWFVGDSSVDLECARKSGCVPVFFGDQFDYDDGRIELGEGELHALTHPDLRDLFRHYLGKKSA